MGELNDSVSFIGVLPFLLSAIRASIRICVKPSLISIAKAVLYRQPTGTPLPTPVADVITVAKRDLKAGERLDGSGGYTVNGLIEKAGIARAENLLPLGLADDIKLKFDVSQGEAISYDMVELNEDSFVLKLRRLQDAIT